MSDRTPTPLTDEELAEVIDRHAPRTPTTTVYLPDPANDETLTMSGYDWWRYRAAIEAEARAEPEGLDVERLARAMHTSLFDGDVWATLNHDMKELYRRDAAAIAREYAAQEPTE